MRQQIQRLSFSLAAVVGLFPNAMADAPPKITTEERALLPHWCRFTQSMQLEDSDQAVYQRYLAAYGPSWSHMHHYCLGLLDVARLYRPRAKTEPGYANANRALGNIDYSISRADKKFPLLPEMLTQRTRLLTRIGDLTEAATTAKTLMEQWPKLPDGYVLFADLLMDAQKPEDARKVLQTADTQVVDKERLTKLKAIMRNRF